MVEQPNNFDWDKIGGKGFGGGYTANELEELAAQYDLTLTDLGENKVVEGTVVGINDREVILNIGSKSDGIVSRSEFRDLTNLAIGDTVDVFVEDQEDANGQLVLSRKKAEIAKAWQTINQALENDTAIEGLVKRRTKGGLIMDVSGVEAFLPGSQIDVKPIRDFDIYVNKRMQVKVVKINKENNNVVVSHKALIEKDIEQQKALILNNLEKGQVLEGVIKNMTNFGVFIDLGGVDGLLHITDISWGRVNHPDEVLALDQKVQIVVMDFDEDKKRISLGMKQLTPHPWESLPANLEIGSRVKGKIVNVEDYGAFLELMPGVEGLIHVSEMSWSQHLRNPQDFLKLGDEAEAVVITFDRDNHRMSLGMKQLTEDPWSRADVLTKYAVGTIHKGIVRNLTTFGLFIELEEGIDGLVHISDLSWTRKVKHPSEFVKVGDTLDVKVIELDAETHRLALGHKQLEENPWETFATVFSIGSIHKGTVISKGEKTAQIELPYGVEGNATFKAITKEDGTLAEVGESMDFKVLEFSKDERRIGVSHNAIFSTDAIEVVVKEKKAATPKTGKKAAEDNSGGGNANVGAFKSEGASSESMDQDGTLAALRKQMQEAEQRTDSK